MNYVQFHVGDWDSSTRLLSPLEKGIYIDLLMLYYSLERPLMRSECERISRAYSDEEKAALKYVLDRFFMADGDAYRHQRCDKELEAARSKSSKAAASAKARWDRQKANEAKKQPTTPQVPDKSDRNADASETHVQTESECNADGMLTNNQEPVTITTKEKVEKEAAKPKAKREPVLLFPDALPEEWRQAALEVRTDVTPERVFLKLRGRFAPTTTKKTMGNWRKIFLGWIGREYPETGKALGKAPLPPHKDPAFHFGKEYYDKSVNPDGTTNWGV